MRGSLLLLLCGWNFGGGLCFWDEYTTTKRPSLWGNLPRQSFFRWRKTESNHAWWFFFPTGYGNDPHMWRCRALRAIAGISIEFLPITTGAILNTRTIITAANPLEEYRSRQGDLRIWALGRAGEHTTPYRYRVWRYRRVLPRSNNPEHQIGPRARFSTRHDIVVVNTRDQMYLNHQSSDRWLYARSMYLSRKKDTISHDNIYVAGTSTLSNEMIEGNFEIVYYNLSRDKIVNCEKYLPKYWGKFICFLQNYPPIPGVLNGASLVVSDRLTGVGAFEIRYNEDRVLVFTDIRYYVDWIYIMSNISKGEYYDYAYQQWGTRQRKWWEFRATGVDYFIPIQNLMEWTDLYPLGK